MSKHIDLSLNDTTDDEETEEYFSNNSSRSSVAPRRPPSRNRAKNKSNERKGNKHTPLPIPALEKMDSDDQSQNLDELTWVDHDESARPNTPISAYLNAFFMTIATVLVRP